MHSSEYLAAFMGGFEFVLRAFEGRVHGADLDAESQDALMAFIHDYRRLLAEYAEGRASEEELKLLALCAPRLN